MDFKISIMSSTDKPPHEYERAMAELERRAACGQLSLAQARHEIFRLRDRFTDGGVAAVMQWAQSR